MWPKNAEPCDRDSTLKSIRLSVCFLLSPSVGVWQEGVRAIHLRNVGDDYRHYVIMRLMARTTTCQYIYIACIACMYDLTVPSALELAVETLLFHGWVLELCNCAFTDKKKEASFACGSSPQLISMKQPGDHKLFLGPEMTVYIHGVTCTSSAPDQSISTTYWTW